MVARTGHLARRALWRRAARQLVVWLTRTAYRIRVHGGGNVPPKGGALLLPNHVSWGDGLLLSAATRRRIRFVMAEDLVSVRAMRWLFGFLPVILIPRDGSPRKLRDALTEARRALADGALVCVFSEGTITRNGNTGTFKPGFERIVEGTDTPVIPVFIGGVWGSIFSYYAGRVCGSLPRCVRRPVDILFGKALPATVSATEAGRAVRLLSGRWFDLRKTPKRTLVHRVVRSGRRRWFHHAVADTTGKRLRYGELLTAAVALGGLLRRMTRGQRYVGILLPASAGAVVTNVALTLLGKVTVNLNVTSSRAALEAAVRRCELRTIVSSRTFLARMDGFRPPDGTVCLEDMVPGIGVGTKLKALVRAALAPPSWLVADAVPGPEDVATVLFSSGSTAEPKGVMLTHHNILSNVEAIDMLFRFRPGNRMCGVLPIFHSFGLTVTLWCPLLTGIYAAYHTNPLDGDAVAAMVRREKLDFLAATPTFLMAYVRRASPEDFATLTAVYVGGEKLTRRVADAFEQRFGLRPLEGYGTTELSPVAAFNVADVVKGSLCWVGNREGSIGRPIPGVAVNVVDEATGEPVPPGREGVLLVKGPNVMQGYLGRDDLVAESVVDGWYNTGDVARVDDDGFIFLLDRLSRFSKIGGEMVPHAAVEEVLAADGAAMSSHPVVVTAAPDDRKGEQLVVLYSDDAGDPDRLRRLMRSSELPNLWRPRERNYVQVAEIPVLGSGKLDLKNIRAIAREALEQRPGTSRKAMDESMETL